MKHCCIRLLVTVINSYVQFSSWVWFYCTQDILDRNMPLNIKHFYYKQIYLSKSKSSLLYIMHSDFTVQIVHKRNARSYVTKNTNSYCRCWKTTRSIFSLLSPLKNDYLLSLQWAVTFAYFTSTSGLYLMVEGDEITWAFVTNYEIPTIFKEKGNY